MDKEQTITVFEKWLESINKDEDLEFEVKYRDRFSNHESVNFSSGVSPGIYKKALDVMKEKIKSNNDEYIVYFSDNTTNRSLYSNTNVSNIQFDHLRIVENSDNSTELMQKTKLKLPGIKNQVFSQGFKLSLSKEKMINESSKLFNDFFEFTAQNNVLMLVRKKERETFLFHYTDDNNYNIPILKIDFTKVNTHVSNEPEKEETTFEIEMEYVGNRYWEYVPKLSNTQSKSQYIKHISKHLKGVAAVFVNQLKYILQLIQQSPVLIDVNEHNKLFLEYLTLIGQYDGREMYSTKITNNRDVFIGCQPESIHLSSLPDLIEKEYIVVDKTDGERMLMFIHQRCIYLIDRFMHISKTGATLHIDDLNNTLLDGEWVKDNNGKEIYLIFDALFIKKKDIRSHTTLTRLGFIKKIVDGLNTKATDFMEARPKVIDSSFEIQMKPFVVWGCNQTKSIVSLSNRPYKTDGYVFIPNTICPKVRKWPELLKWKPLHLNSIDLFVSASSSNEYNLFIHTNIIVHNSKLFILLKNCNNTKSKWLINEEGEVVTIHNSEISSTNNTDLSHLHWKSIMLPFPFQTKLIYETTLSSHCVYEFYYDYTEKTLKPIQLRFDKSSQNYKGSNHLTIATDVWDTICNPVSEDLICNLSKQRLADEEITRKTLRPSSVSSMFCKDFNPKKFLLSNYSKTSSETLQSPIWRIRKFHNYVKNDLISKYCSNSHRNNFEDVFKLLNGNLIEDRYEFPNNEATIGALNSLLGITRKQLKFLQDDKSIFVVPNDAIQHLIHSSLGKTNCVLDIGFGRGGDLWKYAKAKVDNLIGVENESFLLYGNESSAISRIGEVTQNYQMTVNLLHLDARSNIYDCLKNKNIDIDVDCVSCFFAIHYLFRDEEMLTSFMQNIQEMLTHNGFFIGTFIDGSVLTEKLANGVFEEKDIFSIKRKYDSINDDLFGNEIEVYLNDSIIHDYDHLQPYTKKEYLVMFDKFVKFAEHFDLKLIERTEFKDYYNGSGYNGPRLTEEEKKFSFLNNTFVFRKTSNSRYHREHIVTELDDKNGFRYNHAIEMMKQNQSVMMQLQNVQTTTRNVENNVDCKLLENDELIVKSKAKAAPKKVKPIDDQLLKSALDSGKILIKKKQSTKKRNNDEPNESPIEKSKKSKSSASTTSESQLPQPKKTDDKEFIGCGLKGKGCTECKRCKCKTLKRKCVDGACGCDPDRCTNK